MSKKPVHANPALENKKIDAQAAPANGVHNAAFRSRYEEMQEDEIEALRSIFMEDYEDIELKKAWSKPTERSFKIRLHSYSDKSIWVCLVVTLTATYPMTVPLLQLENTDNVRSQTLDIARSIIATKPKELLGEVMIHEIASLIQDELENAASARAKGEQLPSLEQERAIREATAVENTRSQQESIRKREEEEKEEAQRKMQRALDEQMKKRAETRQLHKTESSTHSADSELPFAQINFDQAIMTVDDNAQERTFRSVAIISALENGPVTQVFNAAPLIHNDNPRTFVLKRAVLKTSRSKASVWELEVLLERLKRLRHPNVINVLGFKIVSGTESWSFDILIELGNQGSLADMLKLVEVLPVQKARLFSIELLQALDFYHRNGVVHGRIHTGNIIFHRLSSGSFSLRLADAGYQDALYALRGNARSSQENQNAIGSSWPAPELMDSVQAEKSKSSDIWDFGVVLVEMAVGATATKRSSSPTQFMNTTDLTEPFEDLARSLFKVDPKKRPNAFDITPYEFFRTDIAAVLTASGLNSRSSSIIGTGPSIQRRTRHESSHERSLGPKMISRYANEWDEVGRLGKGGFGEVMKARNRLDGRIYAIKKITKKTPAELSQVLSEVYLLATLNHPYVVRYFTAWPEDDVDMTDELSEINTSSEEAGFLGAGTTTNSTGFGRSTGGLDFISSSGYPRIEFGYDDDEDTDDGEEEEDSQSAGTSEVIQDESYSTSTKSHLAIQRTRSASRSLVKSTLYIQMEYCERLTLRDIIRKGVQDDDDEIWRLFRQILEGLSHIHSHGIIHRDLKPENIFIDSANNTKIGDFGLAKSGQFNLINADGPVKSGDREMTSNVGTALYLAPELQNGAKASYTDKIDMYSLGIIFFEMCYPLKTAMERGNVLTELRQKDYMLPEAFQESSKAIQGDIIDSLLKHRPSERPTCAELLRSGKVPLQIEDDTIKAALQGLADDSSPYYHRMMSALFSKSSGNQLKAQMWDLSTKDAAHTPSLEFVLLKCAVHERLEACFRRHGAVESDRQGLIPRSDYYLDRNVAQLLDPTGTLVQLPYDFTLPHARAIAKGAYISNKSYSIGNVYRDSLVGGAPRSSREADFDIVAYDEKDLALQEAEVIKVVDELIGEIPPLASATMSFHISHAELLDLIMDFCRVSESQKATAKEVLGRLNIQDWTWQKIRLELRSATISVSSTSLDELAQFDFREAPDKALAKLQSIFTGSNALPRVNQIFKHINDVIEFCKRWGVKRKIYFSPLSSFNDKFYKDGMMFQCLFDGKKRDVVAAGGRYDHLVKEHQPRMEGSISKQNVHAVGVNIAWDRLITSMARYQKRFSNPNAFLKKTEEAASSEPWPTRRCDCLVASFDSAVLRSAGLRLVSSLWSNGVSAELAVDSGSPEKLLALYKEDKHGWIIYIKHEAAASNKADLRVKCVDKKEDLDVRSADLISFIKSELREREHREATHERMRQSRHQSAAESSGTGPSDSSRGPVHVLVAANRPKKSNKYRAIEAAQMASQELLERAKEGPIASIETRDEVLEMIRETRLSDAESWRRVVHKVPLGERQYIQEVQELLDGFKTTCVADGGTGAAFVFNFRTGKCVFYDLLA